MADKKKDGGEKAEITVDYDALRRQGDFWDSWGDKFLRHTQPMREVWIAPGDFPAATRLQTILHERRDKLADNSENLGHTFKAIGQNLYLMAASYERGENDIEAENERLNKLFKDVGQFLPEVVGAAPPPAEAPKGEQPKEEKPAQ
jgi:hypothetical protein